MNALQGLRAAGYTVALFNAGQVRIKPQCPDEWLPRLMAAKPEIISSLLRERSQVLTTVEPVAELYGLAIIPDDRRFIQSCLRGKGNGERTALLSEYRQKWEAAFSAEPLLHCKENAGRFAANTWLREAL